MTRQPPLMMRSMYVPPWLAVLLAANGVYSLVKVVSVSFTLLIATVSIALLIGLLVKTAENPTSQGEDGAVKFWRRVTFPIPLVFIMCVCTGFNLLDLAGVIDL